MDAVAAGRELAELGSLLEAWVSRPDWPLDLPSRDRHPLSEVLDGDPCPAISARLALFSTRFKGDFRAAPGWVDFSALATRVHARLVAEYPAPAPGPLEIGTPWISPAWLGVRALLLDSAGCSDDARELLFGDVQRSWDGCCVPDLSEDLYYLACARAQWLDRAGDSAGALRWYHEAFFRCEQDDLAQMFGRDRVARDLVLARYAILLADNHEPDAAASVLKVLEARDSGSLGLAVAASVLGHPTQASVASEVHVFAINLGASVFEDEPGHVNAIVVGDVRDLTTWRVLACELARWPDRMRARRMRPDCGADLDVVDPDDPRVASLLATWVPGAPRAR